MISNTPLITNFHFILLPTVLPHFQQDTKSCKGAFIVMLNYKITNTYSKTLIAFKPRPVLLAQRNQTTTMTTASTLNDHKITSLTPELKSTLHEIILFYLHRNGFSKTLKRFQSEAQIQVTQSLLCVYLCIDIYIILFYM